MEIGWEEIKPGDQEISPGTSESFPWVVAKGQKRRKILEELEFLDLNAASEMGKELGSQGSLGEEDGMEAEYKERNRSGGKFILFWTASV